MFFTLMIYNEVQNGEFGLDFKVLMKTVRGIVWETEI